MPLMRLVSIGAEQEIPPRQIESEITVGFTANHGVVNAVHVGCHDEPSQQPIQPYRHLHVTVIEHRRGVEQNLKDHDG